MISILMLILLVLCWNAYDSAIWQYQEWRSTRQRKRRRRG